MQKPDKIDWEWARAASFMELKSKKNHVYLSKNSEYFENEFAHADIPWSEFGYKGKSHGRESGQHTFGSSGFILMMLLVAINKRFSASIKEKALCLLSNFMRFAANPFQGHIAVACLVYGDDKQYHEAFLSMGDGCIISGFAALLSYNKTVKNKWEAMMLSAWCGQKVRTTLQHASLWDALLLALYLKNHKKLHNCWAHVGQFVFPKLIWLASKVIDALALKLASLPIEQVPLLKGPKG